LLAFLRRIRFSGNKKHLRQLCREVVIKPDGGSASVRCRAAGLEHSKGNGQMNKSRRSQHTFVFAITMLVAFSSRSPDQVKVLISGSFSALYQELLPQFEKSTGITVTTTRAAPFGTFSTQGIEPTGVLM
jgi:hypothetical protein